MATVLLAFTPVPRIRLRVRPTAILRGVWTFIVYAVDLRLWVWPSAHIRDEDRKRIPALAHRNAAPTVSSVTGAVSVNASLAHVLPYLVFRHIKVFGARAARWLHLADAGAAAGRCISADEIVVANGAGRTAIANAFPCASANPSKCLRGEPPEAFPGNIFDCAILGIYSHAPFYAVSQFGSKPQIKEGAWQL